MNGNESYIDSEGKEGWDHPPTEDEVQEEKRLQDSSNMLMEEQIKDREEKQSEDRERESKEMQDLIESLRQ